MKGVLLRNMAGSERDAGLCMEVVTSSSGDRPKIYSDKYFDFKRTTVLCSGHCLSKHKMTRYSRNLWRSIAPLATPGCAYGSKNRMKKKEQHLLDVQSSTDKSSQQRKTARHCRTPMKSNIVSIGCYCAFGCYQLDCRPTEIAC